MRRRTKNFGHFKLLAVFLFISVLIPKFLSVGATANLGDFEEGEYGIKLCAVINEGQQDALRFHVTSDQGFESDVIVENDSCKTISPIAATYTVKEYLPQEYVLDSVAGGTVSADNTPFIITANSQAKVIYTNSYSKKNYLHTFGYTTTTIASTGGGGGGQGGDEDPCESNILYRQIECAAKTRNVVDTNLDFFAGVTQYDKQNHTANYGVNILAENKDDTYPVYYYRGDDVAKNVVWAGKCWSIIRTTGTGGVKMQYNGQAISENGGYKCESYSDVNLYDATGEDYINDEAGVYFMETGSYSQSPAKGGYMYGAAYDFDWTEVQNNETYAFSNDVSYSNGTYTLTGDIISGFPGAIRSDVASNHHYFCLNGGTTCNSIAYYAEIWNNEDEGRTTITYLTFSGPEDIEAAKEAMFSNTHESFAKETIDQWFEVHLLAKQGDLEDTQFCNDREFGWGVLKSKDSPDINTPDMNNFPDYGSSYFVGARTFDDFSDSSYRPNLNCDNTRDTFTVSNENGNGLLKYPVALPTADEDLLTSYSLTGYTMTPAMVSISDWNSLGGGVYMAVGGGGTNTTQSGMVVPVVSLKYGMTYTGGDGTYDNPYIVE